MYTAQFAHKCRNFWQNLLHSQGTSICDRTRHVHRNLARIVPVFRNTASAGGASIKVRCENGSVQQDVIRPYQVVVAATRDMGIGKDGKLPWTLRSDLRYFKEVTTTTCVAGKRNAVIMGRRTWESIPQKFRPLPGRLNVVLSRSGKMGLGALEDVVICSDLHSALKLLAEPPRSSSVEKVFVIGGGQVLKEALNAPDCEAIHLTDIKTSIECDTFIPRIDPSLFSPLLSSAEMVENNIQFSFRTYVRTSNPARNSTNSGSRDGFNSDTEFNKVHADLLSRRWAVFDYLKPIQDRIASSDGVGK